MTATASHPPSWIRNLATKKSVNCVHSFVSNSRWQFTNTSNVARCRNEYNQCPKGIHWIHWQVQGWKNPIVCSFRISAFSTSNIIHLRIQDSPDKDVNPKGTPIYYLTNYSRQMHENEEILVEGMHVPAVSLDPPVTVTVYMSVYLSTQENPWGKKVHGKFITGNMQAINRRSNMFTT